MMFTIFDIIVFLIVAISSFFGVYRGVIYISINLLGFISSIFVAIFMYSYVRIIFSGYVDNDLATSVFSGFVSYIISLIILTFCTSKAVGLFSDFSMGAVDRFLGLMIGVLRGCFFAIILFSVIAIFTTKTYFKAKQAEDLIIRLSVDNYPEWLQNSNSTEYLEHYAKSLINILPEGTFDFIEMPYKNQIEDQDIIDSIKRRKKDATSSVSIYPQSYDNKSLNDE